MVDICLSGDSPIINNDVQLLLQQIDLLFDTTPKEVLGWETWGTTYHDYLYKLNVSNEALKQIVLDDLGSLDLLGFSPVVEVYMLQGTEQDIALIDKIGRASCRERV